MRPRAMDSEMTDHAADHRPAGSPTRDRLLRIVMVDDDHSDQLLMNLAANDAGLRAEFTFHDDGTMLLYRLAGLLDQDALPDLIVLDLLMPGLDGHRTLDELQALPKRDQLMTLECSGNGASTGFMNAIYNSKWTGTPLAPILKSCGLKPSAKVSS